MDLRLDRNLRGLPVGPIIDALTAMLVQRGFIPEPVPLVDLHRHVPVEAQHLDDRYMNDVTRSFYDLGHTLPRLYAGLIRSLAESAEDDFLFQAAPIVRFHFPVPYPERLRGASGRGSYFHSDLMGGHPDAMVNAWLALTQTAGTSALHIAAPSESLAILEGFRAGMDAGRFERSLDDFVAANRADAELERRLAAVCRPLPMEPGDLVLFDPRCIHGGVENVEDATRVSMDFRLVPLPKDAATFEADLAASHPRWRRGDILDRRSARESASPGRGSGLTEG